MEIKSYQRAQQIISQCDGVVDKIKKLEGIINNNEINRLHIGTKYVANIGEYNFTLGEKHNLFDDQPERITILTRAFVVCLLDGYRQELEKLETEFEAL